MEPPDDTGLAVVGITDLKQYKDFVIENTERISMLICLAGTTVPAFYANNATWPPKGPHVTLHSGLDKTAPVIGVSHLSPSGNATIGLGDPDADASNMVWERLHRMSMWKRFPTEFELSLAGERTKFTWKRLSGIRLRLQLVKESQPGLIIAVYLSSGLSWKKRGRLLVRDGCGEVLERAVLLTAITTIEGFRRKGGG